MPKLGLLIEIDEVFTHCSKAFLRSQLWDPERYVDRAELPSPGEIHGPRERRRSTRRRTTRSGRSGTRAARASTRAGAARCAIPVFSRRSGGRRRLAARGVRRRARRVRRAPPRRVDDAAEGLRDELPGRRLPRDAGARRRARAPEVGDVVPGQPGAWAADGDRARDALQRGDGPARSGARRCGGDGAAHRRGRRDRRRHARTARRRVGRGRRLRRQRRRDGADARRARSGAVRVGRRPGPPGAGRGAPRRPRGRLARARARRATP